jgi:hypothetical protein
MSATMQRRWADLCARLGVKPRQFATLVAISAVAVGALGLKSVLKPSKARAAAATAAAVTPAKAGAPEQAAAEGAARQERRGVVELVLESRPARDPFRPFFLSADATPEQMAAQGPAPAAAAVAAAPAPTGLSLRAIIAGEYAVIGEQTVGVGDEVTDGEGRRFTVAEIHERRVVLREGGRRAELGYAVPGAARGAQKGARK